jgi:hypothetical protein
MRMAWSVQVHDAGYHLVEGMYNVDVIGQEFVSYKKEGESEDIARTGSPAELEPFQLAHVKDEWIISTCVRATARPFVYECLCACACTRLPRRVWLRRLGRPPLLLRRKLRPAATAGSHRLPPPLPVVAPRLWLAAA